MRAQECDCDFISSGRSVIDADLIEWYKQNMMKEPVEKRGANKEYWLWEYPNHSKDYVVSLPMLLEEMVVIKVRSMLLM